MLVEIKKLEGLCLKMDNCCGGGCGSTYRNKNTKVLDMMLSLDVVKESNLLTNKEIEDLRDAVKTYEEKYYGDS